MALKGIVAKVEKKVVDASWTSRVTGVSRAQVYRLVSSPDKCELKASPKVKAPKNALSIGERAAVLEILTSEEFTEDTPYQVVAKLMDRGQWLCSVSTMYRILSTNKLVKERRDIRRHPKYVKPVVAAKKPCQLWSWDISRLPGPFKGKYYFLYVMLDVFSRYVVGWMISEQENAEFAQHFIRETLKKWGLENTDLTIHSDRGSPMVATGTLELLSLLGLSQSFSRPRVSDDNAYSESHFKTLKYHRFFEKWYESRDDAEAKLEPLFVWYNKEHRHINLGLMTPEMVHFGQSETVLGLRRNTMIEAFLLNPARFRKTGPRLLLPAAEAGINIPIVRKSASVLEGKIS